MIVLAIIMILGGAINAFLEGDDAKEGVILAGVYLMVAVMIVIAAYIAS